MKLYRLSFLVITICLFSITARSQQQILFSISLKQTPFMELVSTIESQSSYKFYYDESHLDTLKIIVDVNEQPLSIVLEQALKHSSYNYAIDHQNRVYITQQQIVTSLPDGFLQNKEGREQEIASQPRKDGYSSPKNKKGISGSENKLFEIGYRTNALKSGNVRVSGYVRDAGNGEPVNRATIYIDDTKKGVATDQYGYYSLIIPTGNHILRISSIGMESTKRNVMVYESGKLDIEMKEYIPSLKEVVVSADRIANIASTNMGAQKITIKTIKQVPALLGEADVLRVVMALPGVTSAGESSTGLNVRGGSAYQNLTLFSDATIYNPSHFFGFFSAFNPDAVKDVELYKSSIPERFGGRLSSVLDISPREGNNKKFIVSGGIGPVTGRLTVEGPIDSGRTSFLMGGRSTYSNWVLKALTNEQYKNSSANFYDVNLHLSHKVNSNNSIYLTGYISTDGFRLNSDTSYKYNNQNFNIKWKHVFNNKLYGVIATGVDHYSFNNSSDFNPVNAYKFDFNINQLWGKVDFAYLPNNRHSFKFGISTLRYKLNAGTLSPFHSESLVQNKIVEPEQALESAVYIGDDFNITDNLSLSAGIRYSLFNYLGPKDVYQYLAGQPRETVSLIDTVSYRKGAGIVNYHGPEFRLSARYLLGSSASIKASYNTLRQYIQMLSNTTAISPTDIWKLSDQYVKPQLGDQFSLGVYKNFNSNVIETSIEVYYKRLQNVLDYKSGANLVLNQHIETDIMNTSGKAYGLEVMLKKNSGKLNGWISYTYSRVFLKTDDKLINEPTNKGEYYPSDFDKPHIFNFIGNYKFSHRYSMSININYSTGRPITLPIAQYYLGGSYRAYYSDRNEYRIPDYFRTDLSFNIEGNHKIKKLAHSSWTVGVYNLTSRKNPYSVYFVSRNGVLNGYKMSIFGNAIPFLTYNFKF
ncbi:TonB-dependent receptor [Solitalea canadensis]|uniref:Outer membrane receptor protein n=1 Tax=Solitalea canadensis (strain ATCC 29591 / DSM 3403 / JCM 21819 / LMG 8368 / NBRC 15130 / NCIMB 12057 / USAM 9D) TaxID=929556 RepID=H8KL36_SOLCM|nr:TonB-dependent receptor [Solitalea canadensis]AFD09119.1 outer membrane receptor protein [Solitalea canadensis DSM 3403]